MRTPGLVLALCLCAAPTAAQTTTAAPPPAAPGTDASATGGVRVDQSSTTSGGRQGGGLSLRGYGMGGMHWFTASQTFKAVTGSATTPVLGGGLRLDIPGGAYLDVGAWRYAHDGERVFVTTGGEAFPLGIPTTLTMVPLEVTAGWRFPGLFGALTPHAGVGFTSLKYDETSDFADDGEDVSGRFNGFHVVGGVEARLHRWVGVAGEVSWTSIAEGFGDGGASKAFGEDNLGGTSVRIKVLIGR